MRRTKIVATLGPATDREGVLRAMVQSGLDVARFNLSHGTQADHRRRLEDLRAICREEGRRVAALWDTRGPEVRLGSLKGGKAQLCRGERFALYGSERLGDHQGASVSMEDLWRHVRPGQHVLLDDGRVSLRVCDVAERVIHCEAEDDAEISDHRKVTVPGAALPMAPLTDADVPDLRLGAELEIDFVAASFINTPAAVLEVRDVLISFGSEAQIIAKLETPLGIENLDGILRVADGVMVARGDLGVECPPEDVPILQKRAIAAANRLGKPVITATQMLESMVSQPVPTRAEASDVANAIFDGSDAVMLSGETASGHYPLQALQVMARIAERADAAFPFASRIAHRQAAETVPEAISAATVEIAQDLGAAAILTATESGYTTRMVARHRPAAKVLAITPREQVARQLMLVWGATPLLVDQAGAAEEVVQQALAVATEVGQVGEGDVVVYTAGVPTGIPGTTNLIRVHTIGNVVLHAYGVGEGRASGPVQRLVRSSDTGGFRDGSVLVTHATDASMVEAMGRAAAIVAEEGGLTSHAAVVGLSLGVPVLVGAAGALGMMKDGDTVTVDARRGLVYRGAAGAL